MIPAAILAVALPASESGDSGMVDRSSRTTAFSSFRTSGVTACFLNVSDSVSRSVQDGRPCDPDEVRLGVLYPALDRCSIPRTPRGSGFHAFRRAASKYIRQHAGLELAAVQLGHKQMTTTDTFYNERDLADKKRAAELIERAILGRLAPEP